jgi:hypothetical protein
MGSRTPNAGVQGSKGERMELRKQVRTGFAIMTIALAFVVTRPIGAADVVDDDHDGVADEIDDCTDTPEAEIVGSDGCSVCACAGPDENSAWASRDAYLGCVLNAARERKRAHTMSRKAARAAVKAARKSSCGDQALTRCCIYPADSEEDVVEGACRVVTVERCDEMSEQLEWAEDADPGSCLPNPCVF